VRVVNRSARGEAIVRLHTILEHRGPIKFDHDLVRIFIFFHVAHLAQVLGLHQRIVFAISLGSGGFDWGVEGGQSNSRRAV
jgi:hypothetical protein